MKTPTSGEAITPDVVIYTHATCKPVDGGTGVIAFIAYADTTTTDEIHRFSGTTGADNDSTFAGYEAVLLALIWAHDNHYKRVLIRSSEQMVVNCIYDIWATKSVRQMSLRDRIRRGQSTFDTGVIEHYPARDMPEVVGLCVEAWAQVQEAKLVRLGGGD